MATVNLGSIKFKWKGTYAGGTAYTIDDVVSYNGSSYICILASTGNLPTNATYFEQMSSAGTNGTDGTDLTTTLTTQGDIVYRDGSGLQRLGAGTSGQFLKTQGTGANPTWDNLASNVDIIDYQSLDSTGVNSIIHTTDWSTNNYWKIEMFSQYQFGGATTSDRTNLRYRNSSGSITDNSYGNIGFYAHDNTTHNAPGFGMDKDLDGFDKFYLNGWGWNGSLVDVWYHFEMFKPDVNNRQNHFGSYMINDGSSPPYYAYYERAGFINNTSVKTGFEVYSTGSNMQDGYYVIIGHKHT